VSSVISQIAHNPMMPRVFTIDELTWETGQGDVFSWALHPETGEQIRFQPGQFNMLFTYGVGEVPVSISSDFESGKLVHTIRNVGIVTRAMQKLRPGDSIGLRGPFGTEWPVKKAHGKDLLIIAGGIGLAPLRPVIYYCLRHREKFNNVSLLYGTRTPLDILFRSEIESWLFDDLINVAVTVDKAPTSWQGDVGVVTNLLARAEFDPENTLAMICGPEIMMRFAEKALKKNAMKDDQIYLTMERNMKCAIGHCGHCQLGPHFICKDGPVFRLDHINSVLEVNKL
jgi:NAD(P)H-flavin reductase